MTAWMLFPISKYLHLDFNILIAVFLSPAGAKNLNFTFKKAFYH